MSGDENGADPSYVGNDDVNTFYGDVIVSYPVSVVGNGIAQSLYYSRLYTTIHVFMSMIGMSFPIFPDLDLSIGKKPIRVGEKN